MAYSSTLVPSQHHLLSAGDIDNGSPASAGVFGFIARNQHWAASVGLDFTNFLSSPAGFDSTDAITLRLLVPPFCEKVGFSFMATGDNGSTINTPSNTMKNRHVEVAWAGTDVVWTGMIATGDYSDTLSNHTIGEAAEIVLTGIHDTPQNTPRALTVQTTQSAAWVERDVDITIGAGIKVWQGAYFFIPASKYVVP